MKKRQGDTDYDLQVTTINGRHHVRLFYKDDVIDEMACEDKMDIGYISRQMLRWADKRGGDCFTSSVRGRMYDKKYQTAEQHRGRIWYRHQLETMKAKNVVRKRNG